MEITKFHLFMSVMARDSPVDGGGSFVPLKASTIEAARVEAAAIIEDRAPEGGCDYYVDFAVIVEALHIEKIRG